MFAPKFLLSGFAVLSVVGAGGTVYKLNFLNDSSDATKISVKKSSVIFDLEAWKKEISTNEKLKKILNNAFDSEHINNDQWKEVLAEMKNADLKKALIDLFTEDKITDLIEKIKGSLTSTFFEKVESDTDLKSLFEKFSMLVVGAKYEDIKNHPLSKGAWFVVFPESSQITFENGDSKCKLKSSATAQKCNFYDLDLSYDLVKTLFDKYDTKFFLNHPRPFSLHLVQSLEMQILLQQKRKRYKNYMISLK